MSSEGDLRARPWLCDASVCFRGIPTASGLSVTERRELKLYAQVLSDKVANTGSFSCLITNDHELRRLNRHFLGHDYPTDVLSFPSHAGSDGLGEIAISVERAQAQAIELGHSRLDELRILMLHGVLHLTGLDHERDRGEMARAERKWRGEFHLPPTLIARNTNRRQKVVKS